MKPIPFSSLLVATTLLVAAPAQALTCNEALAALNQSYGAGDPDAVARAANAVRSEAGCNETTVARALAQASQVIAQAAGRMVAAGDLDGAEATVRKAPALHWAVQAVRGDIAARRGDRAEAARLYNAALDTVTDPALTPPRPELAPVAERIAKLAQENTMLAGTIEGSVTRGGAPTGVLRMAARGIAIEAVGSYEPQPAAKDPPPKDYVVEAPKAGEDYAVVKDPSYAEPVVDEWLKPEVKPAAVYPSGKKEDYVVADAAAKAVTAVFLPIRYAFDSDHLDRDGEREARRIANFLIASKVPKITLEGHTDDVGSADYNLDLSIRRASKLRDFLIDNGVWTEIKVIGKGEYEPPDYTDASLYSLDERRAIARRVELILGK